LKPFVVAEDGKVVEEGEGGGTDDNPTGSNTSGEGIESIVAGSGILVTYSDQFGNKRPIVSVDSQTIASKIYVQQLLSNYSGGGNSGDNPASVLGLDNPDYAALLTMLDVMEVMYED
jgi:hypothetical protein